MSGVEAQAAQEELVLDPFSYVPDMESRIRGLGGADRPPQGDYCFHTPYVPVAEGVAHFRIRFEGLHATTGTLNLRVHMLSGDSPHARLATAERVALNRLVLLDGAYELRFEAFYGVTYALYGGVIGDTDAHATSLRVLLDRPADPNERREAAAEARDTAFGSDAVAVPFLISLAAPTLAAPVTQVATSRQLQEPIAREWVRRLDMVAANPVVQWRSVYVLQALAAYGMVEPGALGAGLGVTDGPVAAALVGRGLAVDLVAPGDRLDGVPDDLRRPLLCDDEGIAARLKARPASLSPIDPTVVNYDFLWIDGFIDELGSPAEGVRFIEASLSCLRPGGVAVVVMSYDPTGERADLFSRADIERIALILISRGHEAAEFRIDARGDLHDQGGASACGLTCRRAPLAR